MNPVVAAYLQQKQQGQAGLAAAQEQARKNQLYTDLGRSFSTAAQSIPGRTRGIDTSAFDAMDKTNDAPVKEFAAQQEEAKADPTSPQSKAVQAMVSRLYPGKFSPEDLAKISASDTDSILKPLELDEKIQARKQETSDKQAERAATAKEKSDEKDEKSNETANKTTTAQLVSARGDPTAQQAEKDIYASSKINGMFSKYGDINNLSPEMAQLAIMEVSKIASGASPDDHMLHALDPGSFSGKLAGVWQKVVNHPVPANVGSFLKQYKDYADDLSDNAKKVVLDRYGRIIDSNSPYLSDDDEANLRETWLNRWKNVPTRGPSGEATVLMTDPNGKTRKIPASQKDAALKAGGKLVESGV